MHIHTYVRSRPHTHPLIFLFIIERKSSVKGVVSCALHNIHFLSSSNQQLATALATGHRKPATATGNRQPPAPAPGIRHRHLAPASGIWHRGIWHRHHPAPAAGHRHPASPPAAASGTGIRHPAPASGTGHRQRQKKIYLCAWERASWRAAAGCCLRVMLEGAVRVARAFGAGMVSLHGVAARCLESMAMWALGPDGDCDYQFFFGRLWSIPA